MKGARVMPTYFRAVLFAVLTELALMLGSALSFFAISWYAVLVYGLCHPALFAIYLVEKSRVDSMWDSAIHHYLLITAINVILLSLIWSYACRRKETAKET